MTKEKDLMRIEDIKPYITAIVILSYRSDPSNKSSSLTSSYAANLALEAEQQSQGPPGLSN